MSRVRPWSLALLAVAVALACGPSPNPTPTSRPPTQQPTQTPAPQNVGATIGNQYRITWTGSLLNDPTVTGTPRVDVPITIENISPNLIRIGVRMAGFTGYMDNEARFKLSWPGGSSDLFGWGRPDPSTGKCCVTSAVSIPPGAKIKAYVIMTLDRQHPLTQPVKFSVTEVDHNRVPVNTTDLTQTQPPTYPGNVMLSIGTVQVGNISLNLASVDRQEPPQNSWNSGPVPSPNPPKYAWKHVVVSVTNGSSNLMNSPEGMLLSAGGFEHPADRQPGPLRPQGVAPGQTKQYDYWFDLDTTTETKPIFLLGIESGYAAWAIS